MEAETKSSFLVQLSTDQTSTNSERRTQRSTKTFRRKTRISEIQKKKNPKVYLTFSAFSYTQNGLLHMLDRNRRIKLAPERFQTCTEQFDVIITCEERVYDQVIEFLENRESTSNVPVHVINVDIQDNHEEAVAGAFLISDLVSMLAKTSDLDNEIDEVCYNFETENNKNILHCIMFY